MKIKEATSITPKNPKNMSLQGAKWCSYAECQNNGKRNSKLSFFRFPKETNRCNIWIVHSNRLDLFRKPNYPKYCYLNCKLCAIHFNDSYFTSDKRNRLAPDSIPRKYQGKNVSESNIVRVMPIVECVYKDTSTSNSSSMLRAILTRDKPDKALKTCSTPSVSTLNPARDKPYKALAPCSTPSVTILNPIRDKPYKAIAPYSTPSLSTLNPARDKLYRAIAPYSTPSVSTLNPARQKPYTAIAPYSTPSVSTFNPASGSTASDKILCIPLDLCSSSTASPMDITKGSTTSEEMLFIDLGSSSMTSAIDINNGSTASEEILFIDLDAPSTTSPMDITKDSTASNEILFIDLGSSSTTSPIDVKKDVPINPLANTPAKQTSKNEKIIPPKKEKIKIKKIKKSTRKIDDKKWNTLKNFLQMCDEYLPENFAKLTKLQAKLHNKSDKGKRYTEDFLQFSSQLYLLSPKVYKFLQTAMNLPSKSTLSRLASKDKS